MAKPLKATDVFTPGSYPTHTYVERSDEAVEDLLRRGLQTRGQIISVSGPSKSGKTVLVERVVGTDHLIEVTGAGVEEADQIWNQALDKMHEPHETSATEGTGSQGHANGGRKRRRSAIQPSEG